jgi:polysaccharide export outer membrane protein
VDRRLKMSPKRRRPNWARLYQLLFVLALAPMLLIAAQSRAAAATTGPPAATSIAGPASDYRIGLFDKLSVTVFGVKDLESDNIPVDAVGQIQLPLIGTVQAQGRTCRELADEIAKRLDAHYLRDAQVSVIVAQSANQKITVEGAVTDPGVFEIPGRMSLLQAVAMAKGPTNRANLKNVAIYRDVDGKRVRLVFNCEEIRSGKAEDPEMLGNDVVVVSESGKLAFFREVVGDVGAFSIFALFKP